MDELIVGDLQEGGNGAYVTQTWYRNQTGPAGLRVIFKQDCITGIASVSLVTGDEDDISVVETVEDLTVDTARVEIERLIEQL